MEEQIETVVYLILDPATNYLLSILLLILQNCKLSSIHLCGAPGVLHVSLLPWYHDAAGKGFISIPRYRGREQRAERHEQALLPNIDISKLQTSLFKVI